MANNGAATQGTKTEMAWSEEKLTDTIELKLASIEHVSSVTIEGYRITFG